MHFWQTHKYVAKKGQNEKNKKKKVDQIDEKSLTKICPPPAPASGPGPSYFFLYKIALSLLKEVKKYRPTFLRKKSKPKKECQSTQKIT